MGYKDKDKRKAYMHKWYLANREKVLARSKAWREANRKKYLAYLKDWHARAIQDPAWREKEKLRLKEYHRPGPKKLQEINRLHDERMRRPYPVVTY